jgi:hypothetical protein
LPSSPIFKDKLPKGDGHIFMRKSLKKKNPKDVMSFTGHDIGHNPTKLKIVDHFNL